MKIISSKKCRLVLILLGIFLCLIFTLKTAIENRVPLMLMFRTETVSEEQLNKDLETILGAYGLKKDRGLETMEEGDYIHNTYYKKDDSNGKSIFINARPILTGSKKNFTEIETLMEIWIYVINHKFDYEIDGITYYFTAPKEPFRVLSPTEIYMSKDEFLSLYNGIDADNLTHKKKIETLTSAYVSKTGYKRKTGHLQAE